MLGSVTFSSLMSGIDTDSIVSALVGAQRFTINNLENQADELNFYKTVMRSVNTQILNLQRATLNLRLESSFKSKIVSMSHDNYMSATVGFNATPRSYIMEICQLARGASARTGLNNRAYERGAAVLVQNNTAGVSAAEITEETLGGMKASMNSLITETLQAGRGNEAVNAGDQITIAGTTKDGSPVNATFTFNGDSTDTLQRLANTIESAFMGDVEVLLDSNGALMLVETDTSVAGNFSLTDLSFADTDYSGSTLSIGIGTSIASGGAQAQVLTGNRTFTTGDSATIATAATVLDFNLDQLTGGNLDDGEDKIHITGLDHDGNEIDEYYTYTAGDTFQELFDAIETAYGSTVTASMENGKIVITDTTTGESDLSVGLAFEDAGTNENEFSLGFLIATQNGADETEQIIKTEKLEVSAIGKYFLNFTEGKGGQITGTVSLDEDTLLGNIGGLTDFNLFTIDRDTGSGAAGPVTIFGLNERSSVRDLIGAINAQVPDVTASLVSDGAGSHYFQITANRGGEELRITDVAGGILENVLDPSGGSDTDYTTTNSSTDTDDYTVIAEYTSNNGSVTNRTIFAGDEGDSIDNLVTNMSIHGGAANAFGDGTALIYTNESSELNLQPSTHAHIIGETGISSSNTTPRLNVLATLAEAGFATTPENSADNPDYHTDGFFTINGKRIEVDDVERMTVNELIGKINSSGAGVTASYDSASDRFILKANETGASQPITLGGEGDTSNFLHIAGLHENAGGVFQTGNDKGSIDPDRLLAYAGFTFLPGSGTFTINGVKIYIDQSVDTLNTVIDKINNSGAGVIATYDENTDRLVLNQDLNSEIFFDRITVGDASDTSAFLASVRLTDTPSASNEIGTERQNSEVVIDGTTYYRNSNSINDIISDVSFDLKAVTSTPISMDITVDTDRGIDAIAEFVVQYNTMMQLINVKSLNSDEREKMDPLTDEDYNTMTLYDIDNYESNRQSYRERDVIFNESTIRRMNYSLRNMLFNPVKSLSGDISTIADIGINSGIFNAGLEESKTPFLVEDSTDIEVITQKLNENPDLLSSLRNEYETLHEIFSNPLESKIEVNGTIDLILGVTVTDGLKFQLGANGQNAIIDFPPGYYTSAEVVNRIQESLANADLLNDIHVSLDSNNRLTLKNTTENGKANIYLFDLNAGDDMSDMLGITSGIYRGDDAQDSAGLAMRLDDFLESYTGIGGIIQAKITTGGQIDREIVLMMDQIESYEGRLEQYEERLRRQFIQMEMAMAQFNQTSQFLSSQAGSSQNSNKQSGSGLF
ncbi:flagellar filament capping protein FliD [bacterium]|nr:flagellar filament capping protein FliD [bacterium]